MYDPKLSLRLAEACAQAYSDDKSNVLHEFNGEVCRAVVIHIGAGEVAVVYRGTRPDHGGDWLADLDAKLASKSIRGFNCSVHEGFWDALQQEQAAVDAYLASLTPHRLHFAGHSLGGAMAVQHAVQRADVSTVYTFGQPRVGDKRLALLLHTTYPSNYFRVVNDRDMVPHEPKEILGYADSGLLLKFDHSNTLRWCSDLGLPSLALKEGVTDHFMEAYIPLLRGLPVPQ